MVSLCSADGQTPIHVACTNDNEPHLRTLIEAGGNADLIDHRGMSALTLARMYSSNCQAVLEDVIAKREKRTERRNSGKLSCGIVLRRIQFVILDTQKNNLLY